MTREQLKNYRDRLSKLVTRLQRDATTVSEQAFGQTGGQADGGLSNAPMHLGDMGTEAYLQELNATLLENQEYLVKEALDAIHRIDDGTFGRCENCGRPIIRERLDAVPSTRHCTQCAEAIRPGPSVNLNVGRPQNPTAAMAAGGDVSDRHAAGTAGGGTAVGGLAGTNEGRGDPNAAQLETASASSHFDSGDAVDQDDDSPRSGRSGGAVGGTPAGKRARGTTKTKSGKTRRPRAE